MTSGAAAATRVALQLYTLRRSAQDDLEVALDQAADAGYREVEWFGGLWGRSTAELRRLLARRGLGLLAAHVPLRELEDDLPGVMERFRELHCQNIVCPWLDEEQRGDDSRDHWLELGRRLDLLGWRLRAGGFRFAYHNHEFELLPFDDGCSSASPREGLRTLISCRSHDGWGLELDIFWAAFAGVDPEALIRDLGDRIRLLHLKDGLLPASPADRSPDRATAERWFRPLGEGDVDVAACVEAALDAGVRLFAVEQDETAAGGDPARDAAASLLHLRRETALGPALTETATR